MEKTNNATHLADVGNHNVESQLKEIVKNGKLHFKDVTFSQNGYPTNVWEYRALIGFKDQQDAKRWAELTHGEFTLFYREDGWDLLVYKGSARTTDIYTLAGSYQQVVYLNGNENYYDLCDKVFGMSLIDYIKDTLNLDKDEVPESWIKTGIECFDKKLSEYPEGINEDEEDYYNEIEDKVREVLRNLENFKGCKGYTVIDDVNWSVVGEYNTEYPAYYKEDTKHFIFGVIYPIDKEEEIREIIKNIGLSSY